MFKKFIISKTHLISLAYLDFPNFKSFLSRKIVQKYSVSIFAGSTTGDIRHKGESFDVRLNGSVGTSFNRALKLIIYLCKCTWCTRINQSQFLLKRNLQIQHNRQPIRKWFRITRLQHYNGAYIWTHLCISKTATGISKADDIILISAIKLQNLKIVLWIRLNHSLPSARILI